MYSSLACVVPLLAAAAIAGPIQKRGDNKFCNVVFNTDACKHAGWSKVWDTLTANGVSGSIAFTLQSLNEKKQYNLDNGDPCPTVPGLEAARIPMILDPADTNAAFDLLQSDHAPEFLELFNEPDFSFGGFTPITLPGDSAKNLTKLINSAPKTQLIAPVSAYPGGEWLKEFAGNCTGCMDKIPIVSAHVYDVNPDGALKQITDLHDQWPDKRIWVTELSLTTTGDNCNTNAYQESDWMKNVVGRIKALGYVDRIFWNTGTWGILKNNPDVCNPSLTNEDGSATGLLGTYKDLCT